MAEKKKNSPITIAIAGGLATGLGFSVVAPRVWDAVQVSQGLTIAVIGVGFAVGFAATLFLVRAKD